MSQLTHPEIQDIYNLNNIPVLSIDAEGIVIFSNRAAASFLVGDNGTLLGRLIASFFCGEEAAQAFQDIFAEVSVANRELPLQTDTENAGYYFPLV